MISVPAVFEPLFKHYYPYVVLRGGRNSTKSWTAAIYCLSLVMQDKASVIVTRENWSNVEETIYSSMIEIINQFSLPGFLPAEKRYIKHRCGRKVYFTGIRGGSKQEEQTKFKGLQDYKVCLVEEAQNCSESFYDSLLGTMRRKENYQIIFTLNPYSIYDFVPNKLCDQCREDVLDLFVNYNHPDVMPFLTAQFLQDMERMAKEEPEKYRFQYLGEPTGDSVNSIVSQQQVSEAMERKLRPTDDECIGIDIARMGDDLCVFSKRNGPVQTALDGLPKSDANVILGKAKEMASNNGTVFNIDATGDAGSFICDMLRQDGYTANIVRFGNPATKDKLYANLATEMYFTLRDIIGEVSLIDHDDLAKELVNRGYQYDNKDRYKLAGKDDYKKLYNKSPDWSDATVLCYKDYIPGGDAVSGIEFYREVY